MSATPSVYVAATEGATGKSTVALGVVHALARVKPRVGVFRPITRTTDETDYVLDLVRRQRGVIDAPYEDCIGTTYDKLTADPEQALADIVASYHALAVHCDAVVVIGSDYNAVAAPTELALNARVAANLGAPVLIVVSGHHRAPEDIGRLAQLARAEFEAHHAQPVGIVVNRCDGDLDAVAKELGDDLPVWTLPEEPLLIAPTMRQLMDAVGGHLSVGDKALLAREVLDVTVGAMSVEHILERLVEGSVVITPGDRSDVILALLAAHAAPGFPHLSGVILNGGYRPPAMVEQLIHALDPALPIIHTDLRTYAAAAAAANTRGRLTADSPRKVGTAVALFEDHVDANDLLTSLEVGPSGVVTPLMFQYELLDRARAARKHIVLPEGSDDRILHAADALLRHKVVGLTILGIPEQVEARAAELGLDISAAAVVEPAASQLLDWFAQEYATLRAHKGITLEQARDVVTSVSYFGTMMVQLGVADGMVSGAMHTTADTIRPAFEIIKVAEGTSIVSSVFLMCLADRVLVYGDCAVNPDPTAEQLADIAVFSAATAAQFGIEPRIAMLSYSTGTSGSGADVDKVRAATELVRARRPDLSVEGPIQYDAAVDASVAAAKLPGSEVAGRGTVFVFPDLNTGNNTYKAVQRSAGAVAIGPVLQGLRKPVNDLSRGALVEDIVNTVAITAIQAEAIPS